MKVETKEMITQTSVRESITKPEGNVRNENQNDIDVSNTKKEITISECFESQDIEETLSR